MQVLERTRGLTAASTEDRFVFGRSADTPCIVQVRSAHLADSYSPKGVGALWGTTVLYSLRGPRDVFVLSCQPPSWETWLPEIGSERRAIAASADSSSLVSQQIAAIERIMELSDQQTAKMFPGGISRETVNRWRHQAAPKLRPGNLYRLGVLHTLAQRIEESGIDASVWLHQPIRGESATPYQLICRGQLADVQSAVDAVAAGVTVANEPMAVTAVPRTWDAVLEDEEDDGSGWGWDETDGDAS